MFEIKTANDSKVFELYKSSVAPECFFPLIGSVLSDTQPGAVYVDDPDSPKQVYVENDFGFAQIFGTHNAKFESALENYFFGAQKNQTSAKKIRLYGTFLPNFLISTNHDKIRSERQRFRLNSNLGLKPFEPTPDFEVTPANLQNIDSIDLKFDVVKRFWRSREDFIKNANSATLWLNSEPAAICYSAANSNGIAEIDVATIEAVRKRGFGKIVVTEFINKCLAASLVPSWDCFTNNIASMQLCRALGFVSFGAPYSFYTINRSAVGA